MVFQLARLELNGDGQVVGRRVSQPLYERREDAMAMAEYDAAWLGEYGYDSERDCWWARDERRMFRLVVEAADLDVAA
jgi:hypothetical protein